jgi:rfaE bifunctional protein nucleotidyltransferase chain/domain
MRESQLDYIHHKLVNLHELMLLVNRWKFKNEKIVFTNGCFDLIHRGHIEYLASAADLGTKLIIGLNSDNSIQKLKGPNRPVNTQADRALSLGALRFVDALVIFEEETPLELINAIQPDILIKGGDYSIDTIVGAPEVLSRGGRVEIIPFTSGYSTTKLIEQLKKSE